MAALRLLTKLIFCLGVSAMAQTSTTTTMSASQLYFASGVNIDLQVFVSPTAATGTVTFYDGSTNIGTCTLAAISGPGDVGHTQSHQGCNVFNVSLTTVGTHTLTAAYSGGGGYASSTSSTQTALISTAVTSQGSLAGISLGTNGALNGYVPSPNDAWHQNIYNAAVDSNSATVVGSFSAYHLHADFGSNFGIPYYVVDSSTNPPFVQWAAELYSGNSDIALAPIPVGLPIEDSPTACSGYPPSNDQHAILMDRNKATILEWWQMTYCASNSPPWQSSNGNYWDMSNLVGSKRPYTFTSVDAAGLSVFEGLARYDEIAAGVINHALRVTNVYLLCDNYFNDGYGGFQLPATHSACNNGSIPVTYGQRFRLRAGYSSSSCTSSADAVLITALENYGLMVADIGGGWYVQGTPDSRWNDADLTACFNTIPSSSFDMIQQNTTYATDRYPSGTAPTINNFTASATGVSPATTITVPAGTTVSLASSVSGASYSYIDCTGFGGSGSFVVNSTTTCTLTSSSYYLTGDDGFGDGVRPSSTVTINVASVSNASKVTSGTTKTSGTTQE